MEPFGSPPFYSNQHDLYFGYAISTAKFRSSDKLFYAVSAPKANGHKGEVKIFENYETRYKVSNEFSGTQVGEYFGYSILTDDLTGDGYPELIISAPFYKRNDYEVGAVYVYINKWNVSKSFMCFWQKKLTNDDKISFKNWIVEKSEKVFHACFTF